MAFPTTWNPADLTNATLTGSNLIATLTGGGGVRGVDAATSGKGYVEYTYTTINTNSFATGFALSTGSLVTPAAGTTDVNRVTGNIAVNGASSGSTLGTIAGGAVIGVAADLTGQLIWFRVAPAGNWNGSGTANPATGAGGVSIAAISGSFFPLLSGASGDKCTANFGGSAFSGTVPSGFTAGWPPIPAVTAQARAMVLA